MAIDEILKEKPNYYAVIPADVRYNELITPNSKLLYAEITALADKKGFCWANNEYFSQLYNVSKTSISKWVSQLEKEGYIDTHLIYKEGTKQIVNRYIKIIKDPIEEKLNRYVRKVKDPIEEKLKDNTTSINTTSIKEKIYKKESFKKPTLEEIEKYCVERKNKVNPKRFFNYYEANGWKVGKNKMQDWKAAVRTWELNNFDNASKKQIDEKPEWLNKEIEAKIATPEQIAEFEKRLAEYK